MADKKERKFDETPTWAVAGVVAIIIIVSIVLEKVLHKLGKIFTEKHKKALFEALDKVKAELMILGFISLILSFTQYFIASICIPIDIADKMLPCAKKDKTGKDGKGVNRLLLWYEHGRSLAGTDPSGCGEKKISIISVKAMHQVHILIFFLAVGHVTYSAITMALGKLKIRRWKQWEAETSSHDYEFSNDPSRFRLTHETSFVRAHTSFWTRIPLFFYVGCFFRQFFRSVSKSDYLTLRNGFINVHLAPGTKFNFQKYIKRSLEDDYKVVVGVRYKPVSAPLTLFDIFIILLIMSVFTMTIKILKTFSPIHWASVVIFLLLNVKGWQAIFWASIIPLVIILAVGTKLQSILTQMALEITDRQAVVQGIPLVQASDKYFWFSSPSLMFHLIHFVLFQNAFQLTYFLWLWYEYKKINSCFHNSIPLLIIKLVIGVGVLILCSYITLPLYALLSQMGTNMKKSIFDEQTATALKKWRMGVKKKHGGKSPAQSAGNSPYASPVHPMATSIYPISTASTTGATLHRFKTTGHYSTSSNTYEDTDTSDLEVEPLSPESSTTHLLKVKVDYHTKSEIKLDYSTQQEVETRKEGEFSFGKSKTPLG